MRHAHRPLQGADQRFRIQVFRTLDDHRYVIALVCGRITDRTPLLARVHSSCVTSETFGGCDCDCVQQLEGALAAIGQEGRGILFYLPQEGRGAGLVAKARDRMLVQASENRLTTFDAYERLGLPADCRRYDAVSAMVRLLGIRAPLELLTNNPEKLAQLEREKLPIAGSRPLRVESSAMSHHYLKSKQQRGHDLASTGTKGLVPALPEKVTWQEPVEIAGESLVRMASYLLPVDTEKASGLVWLRLTLYVDVPLRRERVVLEREDRAQKVADPRVVFAPDILLSRFEAGEGSWRTRWKACVQSFEEHGAGIAVFLPPRLDGLGLDDLDTVGVRLLDRHLGGRRPSWVSLGLGDRFERDARDALQELGSGVEGRPRRGRAS